MSQDLSEITAGLNLALNQLVETAELEEARQLPPDAPTLDDRRTELNAAFWQAAVACARAAIPDEVSQGLNFTQPMQELLDFGLIPHDALSTARNALASEPSTKDVSLLHESLGSAYESLTRRHVLSGLQEELEALEHDIELWPSTHLAHIRYRSRKLSSLLADEADRTQALELYRQLDDVHEKYQRMAALQQAGKLPDNEQDEWLKTRELVQSARGQIQSLMQPFLQSEEESQVMLANEVQAAAEATDASVAHLSVLHERRRELEQLIYRHESDSKTVHAEQAVTVLASEIRSVASLTRLAARYAGVSECAVPVDCPGEWVDGARARECCRRIVEFDPYLFDNAMAREFGVPDVLLAPGVGTGVFDGARNRWVVPQRSVTTPVESFAHAAILYRLHVDDARSLLDSYREEIPSRKHIRANLKLRMELIRDYITWMNHEAAGEDALPRDVRAWFEQKIAPDKYAPQIPSEYRGAPDHHLKAELATLNEDAPDAAWRRAMIHWILAPDDETARTKALTELTPAVQLGANYGPALYSAGVLAMAGKDFQRAIDYFQRFVDSAAPSWWTRKAVELSARCR